METQTSLIRPVVVSCKLLLGYYSASSSNFLLIFQNNLSFLSSGFKNSKKKTVVPDKVYVGNSVDCENSQ